MDNYAYVPFFLLIVSIFFVKFGLIVKSFISPVSLWFLAWMALFFFAIIFGSPYYFSLKALSLMTLGCIAFGVGAVLSYFVNVPIRTAENRHVGGINFNTFAFSIQLSGIILGVVGAIDLSNRFGSSILNAGSFSQITSDAASNVSKLYSGELLLTPLANFSFSAIQLGFLFSGAYIAKNGIRKKSALLGLLGLFFTALLWTSITTTRSYFVVSMVWWVASFYATKVFYGKQHELLDVSLLIKIVVGLVILVVLIIFFQSVRLGNSGVDELGSTIEHMRPWVAGYIPAFSVWVDESWNGEYYYGQNIIRPVLKIIGLNIDESSAGSVFPVDIGNLQQSNALTIYRVLFYDFGYIGCIVVTFFLGFVAQLSYRLCNAGSLTGWSVLVASITVIIWSPNYWFFNYGSRILVFIVIIFLSRFFGSRLNV